MYARRTVTVWTNCLVLTALAGAACVEAQAVGARQQEPVIGGPCEGCEAVFVGLPDSSRWAARIAPADEPGEPMIIEGTVFDGDGQPAAGVIVYAYHTDASGVYPEDERLRGTEAFRHGRLRGWARTDSMGRYRFTTIRPASYPSGTNPAHVHMHVIEPGCCTYWIASIHFSDDPLLSDEEREEVEGGRGGDGLVTPGRDAADVWQVRRDIVLGRRVPGYEGRSGEG
jgi:protocatechuate 3,4-dioxygenase beta subunit